MSKQNSTKVILKNVRLSFANLLEPKSINGGEPKYSTQVIIEKSDTENIENMKKAIDIAYKQGLESGRLKRVKRDRLKTTLHDAEEKYDFNENPEYEDTLYINLNSKRRPGLINKYKDKTDDPEEVYSGVYANVSLNFYPYNTSGNKGVSAGLNNVMVLGKGERLGGQASAESDFADFEAEDSSDGLDDIL